MKKDLDSIINKCEKNRKNNITKSIISGDSLDWCNEICEVSWSLRGIDEELYKDVLKFASIDEFENLYDFESLAKNILLKLEKFRSV